MIHDNQPQHDSELTDGSASDFSADNCSNDYLKVGAYDWLHPEWQGEFYPDDLPEDWQLSYYANEFSVVLVPEARWSAKDLDLQEWSDEVPGNFRFYLQCKQLPDDTRQEEVKKCLANKLAGFVPEKECKDTETINIVSGVALIDSSSHALREWRVWLESNASTLNAVFLKDSPLIQKNLHDFKSLVEMLNL